MLPNGLLNWWAAYPDITVPPTVCATSPDGQVQAANAVIAQADWEGLFTSAAISTVLVALLAVLLTYYTRKMGDRFASRWRWSLLVTALLSAVIAYLVISLPEVHTFGCEFGDRTTNIPVAEALMRSSVAFFQGVLWFLIWSLLLTRLVRIGRWQPWYNNSRYPI
jgi:hypothetical protein